MTASAAKLRARDLDEGQEVVTRIYCPTRHVVVGRGRDYQLEAMSVPLGELRLNRTIFGATTRVIPCTPRPFHVLNFGRAIRTRVTGSAEEVRMRHLGGFVVSSTEEYAIDCTSAPMLGLVVPTDVLHAELRARLGHEPPDPLVFQPHIDLGDPAIAGVHRLVQFLFDELHQERSVLDSPLTIGEMERVLCGTLLDNLRHNYSDVLAAGDMPTSLALVRRIEEYIEGHADEPIDSEALARVAHCSASAIHRAFRRHRDTTPMRFLRSVRMTRARADLLEGRPGTSVTQIALRWGFAHLGRFSIEYRQRFGESPSTTLRRRGGDSPLATPPPEIG